MTIRTTNFIKDATNAHQTEPDTDGKCKCETSQVNRQFLNVKMRTNGSGRKSACSVHVHSIYK